MSRQVSLFWRLSEHLTAGEFRKRFSSVNGIEPPKLLFWHGEDGQTIKSNPVGDREAIDTPEQTSPGAEAQEKTQSQRDHWKRKRGPYDEKTLLNEDRTLDTSMAMIRFFHTKNSVGIAFLGPEMIAFANENLPIVLDCAEQAIGPARLEVQDVPVSLELGSSPRMWVIPSMALRNPNFDFLSPQAYCERIIRQDVIRQAKILGIDIPSGFYIKVTHIADTGSHWVRTGSVNASKGGKTGGAMVMKGVEFVSNLDFNGYWAAGSLISKGFGRFVRPYKSGQSAGGAEHG